MPAVHNMSRRSECFSSS